jgi:ribosomal protein S18 acetylase RimI-like enzyme
VAGIRPYRPTDREALYEVCLGTGDSGADATGLYDDPRLLGEVYVGPYLSFAPEFAWVYANETDTARGYVLGALDTASFHEMLDREWWPQLRARYGPADDHANPRDREVVEAIHDPERRPAELLADYPSHLHIDMLPDVRGGGRGGAMLATLLDALTAAGSPGVHLGVARDNPNAIGFYRHLGFAEAAEDLGGDELVMCRRLGG